MRRIDSVPDPLANPTLEIRDLRVVAAIAAAGTTARAGEILHLTQSAVSRALLAAEARLGVALFERTARGLVPTPAGQAVVDQAGTVLASLVDLERRVRVCSGPVRLRIVCECYTAYHWLPSVLGQLRESLPGIELALGIEHTRGPIAALVAGELDVALLTSTAVPPELEEGPLFCDEVVFVMAADHPLASRPALTVDEVCSVPLLAPHPSFADGRWFVTTLFGRERSRLQVQQVPLTEAIVDLTRAGHGIAVLSEWIAAPQLSRGDLVAKRLVSGPLQRPWRLAWRGEVRDAAQRLRAALAATVPHPGTR